MACSRSQSSRAACSRSACLAVSGPDRLLEAQVDRHAQRGERRAELVRHRGHQVVLQLVEAEQPGDVLEHHRHPGHLARSRRRSASPAAGRCARPPGRPGGCASSKPRGHVGPLAADARGRGSDRAPPARPGRRPPAGSPTFFSGSIFSTPLAARLTPRSLPPRLQHHHRVGQAVDGRLRRLLRLQQLAQRARPVALQAVGHGVELRAPAARSRPRRRPGRAPSDRPAPKRRTAARRRPAGAAGGWSARSTPAARAAPASDHRRDQQRLELLGPRARRARSCAPWRPG